MKWSQFSLPLLLVFAGGCSKGNAPTATQEAPPAATYQLTTTETLPNTGKLSDIGTPDAMTREIDGILVVGSALTDDHVAAIRLLTDADAPKDAKKELGRNIQHKGPNKVLNIWQGRHFESYQSLVLTDGAWELEETGGGFGTFR